MWDYSEQMGLSHVFFLTYPFAKKYGERHCGPSRGALTAQAIVLRNNQDHIGPSRIKNINFKLSRWHRSTVTDNVPRPRRRWLYRGDQWRRSPWEIRPNRDYRYINIKKRNGRRNGHRGERGWQRKGRALLPDEFHFWYIPRSRGGVTFKLKELSLTGSSRN